jgi:hypothetical protein
MQVGGFSQVFEQCKEPCKMLSEWCFDLVDQRLLLLQVELMLEFMLVAK